MAYINILSQGLFVVPLAIIILINLLPQKISEKIFCFSAAFAAVYEMVSAAFLLYGLYINKINVYTFNISVLERSHGDFFSIRKLSLFLMFCIGLVCLVSAMIAKTTIKEKQTHYVSLLMCLILGMNGMLFSTDLFSLYVFLEIVGISSFVLIALFKTKTGLEGAFKYLVVSAVGVMFLLVGLSFIFIETGSLKIADCSINILAGRDTSEKVLIFLGIVLMFAGFAVKAGAVPFHSWLPDAHQSSDTAVSVLLSGIVIKIAGIYGLIVLNELFGQLLPLKYAYQLIGVVSIIYGAVLAARQTHFKRICAYSSVSQMGYIILAISADTKLGLIAAAAHIFSHAVFKSTLFTNAAALHEQAGTLDINEMGGLEKNMPVTSVSSLFAFLSTAGIPPMAGFWSKFLVIAALWKAGYASVACVALIASILTSAYFLRLQKHVFFGKIKKSLKDVKEIKGSVKLVEIGLTAITIITGLLYPFILHILSEIGLLA